MPNVKNRFNLSYPPIDYVISSKTIWLPVSKKFHDRVNTDSEILEWTNTNIKEEYGLCYLPEPFREDKRYVYAIWFESLNDCIFFKMRWETLQS